MSFINASNENEIEVPNNVLRACLLFWVTAWFVAVDLSDFLLKAFYPIMKLAAVVDILWPMKGFLDQVRVIV